jgi:hypothetical protein
VESRVERGPARGVVAAHILEPLLDRLERERVVAHDGRRRGGEELERGVGRLAAVVHGRGLTQPDDPVVLQLQPHHGLAGARAARDAELLGERERGCAGTELHGRTA